MAENFETDMSCLSRLSDVKEYLEMWQCFTALSSIRREYLQPSTQVAEQRWLERRKKQGDEESVGDVQVATLMAQAMVAQVYRSAMVNVPSAHCEALMHGHKQRKGDDGWWLCFWEGICRYWPPGRSGDTSHRTVPKCIPRTVALLRARQDKNMASKHLSADELRAAVVRSGSGLASLDLGIGAKLGELEADPSCLCADIGGHRLEDLRKAGMIRMNDKKWLSEFEVWNTALNAEATAIQNLNSKSTEVSGHKSDPGVIISEGPHNTALTDKFTRQSLVDHSALHLAEKDDSPGGETGNHNMFPSTGGSGPSSTRPTPVSKSSPTDTVPLVTEGNPAQPARQDRYIADTTNASRMETTAARKATLAEQIAWADKWGDSFIARFFPREAALGIWSFKDLLPFDEATLRNHSPDKSEAHSQFVDIGGTVLHPFPPPAPLIDIVVVTEYKHAIYVSAEPSDTVNSLKSKIEKYVGFPPARQCLSFCNVELDGKGTLSDYGIRSGSNLYLKEGSAKAKEDRKEEKQGVEDPPESALLGVWPSDTVGSLKSKIESDLGVPTGGHRLLFNDTLLDDHCTLGYYGIEDQSDLILVKESDI